MRNRKRAKPASTKLEPELAAARRSLRNEASKRRELEKRLAGSLEREKATGEILRVISSARTDAQLVFDTIVQSAVPLCNAATAAVFRTDGSMLYHPANYGSSPEALAATRARYLGR
jgi:hypothetical protein